MLNAHWANTMFCITEIAALLLKYLKSIEEFGNNKVCLGNLILNNTIMSYWYQCDILKSRAWSSVDINDLNC